MNRSPCLDPKDFVFFFTLGVFISFSTMLSSIIHIPEQMDRGYLVSLYTDHVPFTTIIVLLFGLVLIQFTAIALQQFRISGSLSQQCVHLSNRISQLCSPAFFITLGLSVAPLVKGLCTKENVYYFYFVAYFSFSLVLVFISWAAKQFSDVSPSHKKNLSPIIATFITLVLIACVIWAISSDESPKDVSIKLNLKEYEKLKNRATEEGVSVEEFIKRKLSYNN